MRYDCFHIRHRHNGKQPCLGGTGVKSVSIIINVWIVLFHQVSIRIHTNHIRIARLLSSEYHHSADERIWIPLRCNRYYLNHTLRCSHLFSMRFIDDASIRHQCVSDWNHHGDIIG